MTLSRSEERRVGKECRSRLPPYKEKRTFKRVEYDAVINHAIGMNKTAERIALNGGSCKLQDRIALLEARFAALGDKWQHQEHTKFSEEFRDFFFQAEDGIRDHCVTGVQTCALPILRRGECPRANQIFLDGVRRGESP